LLPGCADYGDEFLISAFHMQCASLSSSIDAKSIDMDTLFWTSVNSPVFTLVVVTTTKLVCIASTVPNSRARFATAASPLEPWSFKSLRRGYRPGTKERKCHGFDEEVSLPTFLESLKFPEKS
jgi:hypothetical protein